MAEKQIFERGYDFTTINGIEICNRQFSVLGDRIERMKKELLSNTECYDYILKEINKENDNINRLLMWNQKRLILLNEIGDKCKKLNENLYVLYEELFDIVKKSNENKIETPK